MRILAKILAIIENRLDPNTRPVNKSAPAHTFTSEAAAHKYLDELKYFRDNIKQLTRIVTPTRIINDVIYIKVSGDEFILRDIEYINKVLALLTELREIYKLELTKLEQGPAEHENTI